VDEEQEVVERRFTVDEANALIDGLRPRLEGLRAARRVILRSGRRIRRHAALDGGGSEGSELWRALGTVRREAERLAQEGIILRDAEDGLIDFPSERDGRPVLLCWRLGEDRVAWWHPPDTGFTGRKPL
jgi:hypothetical protein